MSGLDVLRVDRFGPAYSMKSLVNVVTTELNSENGTYITRGVKMMTKDIDTARTILNEAEKTINTAITNYQDRAGQLSATVKKSSGDVRKAADDLAQGLVKVQKQADFNNLERYVLLLERAAVAMTTLAELEKAGKLQKIAGALK